MDLEAIRTKNIKRNEDLLKKLDLDSISNSIATSLRREQEPKTKKARKAPKPRSPQLPTRRSKRFTSSAEDEQERLKEEKEAEEELARQQELNDLRRSRILGDHSLIALRAEPSSGNLMDEAILFSQDSVPAEDRSDAVNSGVELKGFNSVNRGKRRSSTEGKRTNRITSMSAVKDEFKRLSLVEREGSNSVKLTPNRITAIDLHPDLEVRLVSAGDTSGCLGLWVSSTAESEISSPILLKPHGRAIPKICSSSHSATSLLTASYDGSCKSYDLSKQMVKDAVTFDDPDGFAIGLSDITTIDGNIINITTLSGQFYQHDMRLPKTAVPYRQLLRLHDKKIGGLAINPNDDNQIATSSLDRTLKLWDLRRLSVKHNKSGIEDNLSSPANYGSFTSKLSISTVDWNSNNKLVSNGYDDTINLIDVHDNASTTRNTGSRTGKRVSQDPQELKSTKTIRHNCQTGRWVSILKAKWQRHPLDGIQKFVIANMNRSIDVYDETGYKIAALGGSEMTAVPAVVRGHNLPDSNDVVSVTGEQVLTISRPSQRDGLWVLSLSADGELRLQLVQQGSLLQVEDLDTRRGGGSQPVSGWGESQSVNLGTSVQGVQGVVGVEVPQDDDTILTGRGVQGSIWGDSDTRDVAGVTNEISVKLVVASVPRLIVRSGNNSGGLLGWGESDSRDPVLVSGQGDHALTNSVPDLDGLVTRGRNNSSQVGRDGNRQDVTSVADELLGRLTSLQVPQSQSLVPRAGQSVGTVSRDGDILNDVRVADERLLWHTVLVALTTGQLPGDQGLVSGTRQQQIGLSLGSSQRGDPTVVALQSSSQNQNFLVRHCNNNKSRWCKT